MINPENRRQNPNPSLTPSADLRTVEGDTCDYIERKLSVWSGIEDVVSNPVQPIPMRPVC
jgi:hypothetical protein